ncbi:hypothetical protein HanPSC8_Chr01g0019101 [Helianthus annuus]|nr:hypothetical protein HanPSC8_Chr01g0019101 [Helianthus annuus]
MVVEDPSTILMFLIVYLLHNCTCISCDFPFSRSPRTWCSRGRGRGWSLLHMGRRGNFSLVQHVTFNS